MSGIREIDKRVIDLEAEVKELKRLVTELLLRPQYVPYYVHNPAIIQPPPVEHNTPYVSPYAEYDLPAEPPFQPVDDGMTEAPKPVRSERESYYAKLSGKTQESDLVG